MTENQTKEMFNLLTGCVNGIQELKEDVSVLKKDVSILKEDVSVLKQNVSALKQDMSEVKSGILELNEGQNRIEKQIRLNNNVVNELAGEQLRINARVAELEKATV